MFFRLETTFKNPVAEAAKDKKLSDLLKSENFVLSKEIRNCLRRSFLKVTKKVLRLKSDIECNIKNKELENMARQAKIDDISIPVFDGANFKGWKFRLLTLLEYKECDVQAKRVRNADENEAAWKKSDLKAKAILISAVSDKQLEYINECTTTFEMLSKLQSIYSTKSTSLQIINRGKLEEVKLKNYNTVEDFFVDFEKACNEFKSAGGQLSEEEKLRHLIKALPPSYSYIGDFIDLVKEEQRTVEYVKSKIKEKNLSKNDGERRTNVSTFNARTRECYDCGKPGHLQKNCWKSQQSQRGRGDQRYQGRGTQWSQRGSSRGRSRERGTPQQGRGRSSSYGYHQAAGPLSEDAHETWATQVLKVNVSEAKRSITNSQSVSENEIEWLLDSGCTDHIVNSVKYFCNHVVLRNPISVKLPDDKCVKATKVGTIDTIFENYYDKVKVRLTNVYYAEGIKQNLISFSKITENSSIIARNGTAKIYNNNRKLIAVANKVNGLYTMKSTVIENEIKNLYTNTEKITEKEKWHRALGHVNFRYLSKLVNSKLVEGLPEKLENDLLTCANCIESKMSKVPFKNDRSKTSEILELIHTDLNGPHRTTGYGGEKYFLTFIDDYSKCAKIYCIKRKSETANCFKEFVNLVENRFNKRIKKLRCDNGKEYMNNEIYNFARDKGIEILPSPPYVHELNGVAERYNRSAMNMGRCLAKEAKINHKYWPEIMKTVSYLKNRTIANTHENQTPFEIFCGKKPSV